MELLGYRLSQHAAPGACGMRYGANCMSGLLQLMLQVSSQSQLRRLEVGKVNLESYVRARLQLLRRASSPPWQLRLF